MHVPNWLRAFPGVCLACAISLTAAAETPYATKVRIGTDIELSLYSPSMFRLRVSAVTPDPFPARYEIPFAMGHLDPWPEVHYTRHHEGPVEIVDTALLSIRIDQATHAFTVSTRDGHPVYPSSGPIRGLFRDGYALFDAASAFNERNRNSRYEHWFYSPDTGRYVDTWLGEDLIHDDFFIYGPDYGRLYAQLNDLVGPEPLPPKKAFGFFQTQHEGCRGSATRLLDVAKRLRSIAMPVDTLIIDYEWGDGCPGGDSDDSRWGGLDWAPNYSAPISPAALMDALHAMHFDVMTIHHSAPNFPHRQEDTVQRPGDWTSKVYPESVWWEKLREQFALGINGTWQDTRQNDVTDGVIWNGIAAERPGRRVLFMGNRNVAELDPWELKRDDTLTVTSLIGSRRYPFRWTGDLHTTWSELRFQIDAITNSQGAMKGVSYITADAYAKNWIHQARWNQFLAFAPIARSHTMKPWDVALDMESLRTISAFQTEPLADPQEAATRVEPEMLDDWAKAHGADTRTAEASMRKHLRLRYRLLPYLYSIAHVNYRSGLPIARPMVLACSQDPHCSSGRWPSQYLLGDALLIAPVWADLQSMEVYLPAGSDWIDYWSGRRYPGGQQIDVDTHDPETLPLFVRAGSILPMRDAADWIEPAPDRRLELQVYPAEGRHETTLYEDDGETTAYQRGEVAVTSLVLEQTPQHLMIDIGATQGSYIGMPEQRDYEITLHDLALAEPKHLSVCTSAAGSLPATAVVLEPVSDAVSAKHRYTVTIKLSVRTVDGVRLEVREAPCTANQSQPHASK